MPGANYYTLVLHATQILTNLLQPCNENIKLSVWLKLLSVIFILLLYAKSAQGKSSISSGDSLNH